MRIENEPENESKEIEGRLAIIIIPSNIIDIYTRSEVLTRIKTIWTYRYFDRS